MQTESKRFLNVKWAFGCKQNPNASWTLNEHLDANRIQTIFKRLICVWIQIVETMQTVLQRVNTVCDNSSGIFSCSSKIVWGYLQYAQSLSAYCKHGYGHFIQAHLLMGQKQLLYSEIFANGWSLISTNFQMPLPRHFDKNENV